MRNKLYARDERLLPKTNGLRGQAKASRGFNLKTFISNYIIYNVHGALCASNVAELLQILGFNLKRPRIFQKIDI